MLKSFRFSSTKKGEVTQVLCKLMQNLSRELVWFIVILKALDLTTRPTWTDAKAEGTWKTGRSCVIPILVSWKYTILWKNFKRSKLSHYLTHFSARSSDVKSTDIKGGICWFKIWTFPSKLSLTPCSRAIFTCWLRWVTKIRYTSWIWNSTAAGLNMTGFVKRHHQKHYAMMKYFSFFCCPSQRYYSFLQRVMKQNKASSSPVRSLLLLLAKKKVWRSVSKLVEKKYRRELKFSIFLWRLLIVRSGDSLRSSSSPPLSAFNMTNN